MKDGIYRVTLTIDGQPVVAEAHVRNGVLQGLGELAGLVGVMSPGMPLSSSASTAALDAGRHQELSWKRRDLDPRPAVPLAADAAARSGICADDVLPIRQDRDVLPTSSLAGASIADGHDGVERVYYCEWPGSGRLSQIPLHS